jgi:hypothetical protein
MRPITSSNRCFTVRSSQCSPLPPTSLSLLQPFSRHARARPRAVRASESRKRPRFARLIAASNADTEGVCCPSATCHRPSTLPARTFEAALKLKLSCISARAKLRFDKHTAQRSLAPVGEKLFLPSRPHPAHPSSPLDPGGGQNRSNDQNLCVYDDCMHVVNENIPDMRLRKKLKLQGA